MNALKGADLQEVHPWKLLAMCGSNDSAVNVAAIHAIKDLGRAKMCQVLAGGYPELIDRILGEVTDTRPEIRAAMAHALGSLAEIGDQKVIEELMLATEDDNDYVRAASLSSLALITPRESSTDRCTTSPVRTVLARTKDDDSDVREAAIFALGALAPIGDKLATETVLQALEDDNPTVNAAAVDGLILLGDVHELEEGENQLLEMRGASVHIRDTKFERESKTLARTSEAHVRYETSTPDLKGRDNITAYEISVAVEPDIALAGGSGPIQALQYWITLFGVQDFETRLQGKKHANTTFHFDCDCTPVCAVPCNFGRDAING
jgi:NAD-specific glutamate dehydrogenase